MHTPDMLSLLRERKDLVISFSFPLFPALSLFHFGVSPAVQVQPGWPHFKL